MCRIEKPKALSPAIPQPGHFLRARYQFDHGRFPRRRPAAPSRADREIHSARGDFVDCYRDLSGCAKPNLKRAKSFPRLWRRPQVANAHFKCLPSDNPQGIRANFVSFQLGPRSIISRNTISTKLRPKAVRNGSDVRGLYAVYPPVAIGAKPAENKRNLDLNVDIPLGQTTMSESLMRGEFGSFV